MDSETWARPRWATPRTPGRPTYGPAVAKVAARLGRPFLPWQHYVENVAGEVLDDGRFAYPIVVEIVPRRAGKTLHTLARSIQRCTIAPGFRSWYTAQTGGDAGLTFREDWVPIVKASPLGSSIKTRLSNGSESMTLPRFRSRVGLFAPTEKALHGQAGDHVVVDEAWAFSDLKGTMLEAAMRPAMITRKHRQLWIVSAGGTDESSWLLRYRELGRALASRPDQSIAYFEWHPPVDEYGEPTVDLDDPRVWADVHPAVGFTIDEAALLDDFRTMPRDVFLRSYLNVFQSAAGARLIPEAPWRACRDEAASIDVDRPGEAVLGFDVALDYSAASIGLAQRDGARHVIELADYREGDGWLADRIVELRRRWGVRLVANGAGPVRSTTRLLRERGETVEELTEREFVDASGEFLRDVSIAAIAHRGQGPLDEGAKGAGKRELGDGWAFTRKNSASDVSPVVAVAVALYAARRVPARAPVIRFADDAA